MSNIINPILPVGGAELTADRARGPEKVGSKFADHLDRRLDSQARRNQDQLGVRACEKRQACPTAKPNNEEAAPEAEAPGEVDALVLFLQDIQQVAKEKGLAPGEWSVALPEGEILADLAQQAGMGPEKVAALVERFQAKNGELDLDSFLQALIDHFNSFAQNPAIVVPATEFPMLEALLAKMGLSPEQLADLSAQITVGNGDIDLTLLSQALAGLKLGPEAGQAVTLTPWEAEQLQGLLGQAGIPLGGQLELLPEQVFGEELVLTLERLQSLLKEAVVQARDNQPQLQLATFLGSLEQVMEQAGFADKSVGFSPLVQGSLKEAYRDLLEMYDQARVRFEEGLGAEDEQLQGDIRKWLDGVVARTAAQGGDLGADDGLAQDFTTISGSTGENLHLASGEEFTLPRQEGVLAGQPATEQSVTPTVQPPVTARPLPILQQHHILNQLSLAVARGMRSGEQHMVLRMFPAELGEVKVDLTVRNEVVSVAFTMENSKVKETLEASMEEFRQNMAHKGFTLQDVDVFVGQNQEDNGAWQRFEMAWSGERLQAQNLGDLPADVLYNSGRSQQYASQEDGVNLFV